MGPSKTIRLDQKLKNNIVLYEIKILDQKTSGPRKVVIIMLTELLLLSILSVRNVSNLGSEKPKVTASKIYQMFVPKRLFQDGGVIYKCFLKKFQLHPFKLATSLSYEGPVRET